MFGQLFRLLRVAGVNPIVTPSRGTVSKGPRRRGRPIVRIPLATVALAAAACCLGAGPASASQNQLAGMQTPGAVSPACTDPQASFTMTGDLVGCWYEDWDTFAITKDQTNPSTVEPVHFSGTEHFTGCLDRDGDGACTGDPKGTLFFTFTFTGQYVPGTDLALEIRGRCHHPIVGGTGDFAGATGVINFKDDTSNPAFVLSPYMGHVSF
jgi:hypothetical protein